MKDLSSENKNIKTLPMIPLRGKVLFPKIFLNFDVGRVRSITAVERAQEFGSEIFIASQKNAYVDYPTEKDVFTVGVVAKILQVVKVPNGNVKLKVEALYRAKVESISFSGKSLDACFVANIEESPYVDDKDPITLEAYFRIAKDKFNEYALIDRRISKEIETTISSIEDPNAYIDNALSILNIKSGQSQEMLEIDQTSKRLLTFQSIISKEIEIAKIEKKIASKVRQSIDQNQKEFYLREQIKAIHTELGDDDCQQETLIKKIKDKNFPKDIEEKALKEVARLDKINPSSPDYSIILNYLEWLLDLPFNEVTDDTNSLEEAKNILEQDHFGLEKVKERIVEYIAVLKLTGKIKGPILCFVGPPGVGKTSVATSIARALGRKFVRMSLGGVKDEAEIRGHRRTYVGAMPGRIIYGLKNVGSSNPVFLLDEIDKMSSDIHGDPASALLEVLDPEQNSTFRDRYMEIPYDLSKVMFITTANSLENFSYPLLDRMEVIELNGYTDEEKLQIAKRYLIPKALKQNGVSERYVEFTDDGIKEIIEGYTMEAGVRNLEREIGSVVRKIATKICVHPKMRKQIITSEKVSSYLGAKRHNRNLSLEKDEVGACTGLAWTSVGGTTLTIEVGLMHGKGEILLTGKLGDVMKESARAAISYIRANASKYDIKQEVFENTDIHIHVPEGATPKDGPSAGITMATAILSAFTGKAVKKSVAMTGEITLRGKVLPIGGLKEKALAAFRQGIKTIIIPNGNIKDVEEIDAEIRKSVKIVPVTNVDEVFRIAIDF